MSLNTRGCVKEIEDTDGFIYVNGKFYMDFTTDGYVAGNNVSTITAPIKYDSYIQFTTDENFTEQGGTYSSSEYNVIGSNNLVDLTPYSRLVVEGYDIGSGNNNAWAQISVSLTKTKNPWLTGSGRIEGSSTTSPCVIDLTSVTGSYYISFWTGTWSAGFNSWWKMTKAYLER